MILSVTHVVRVIVSIRRTRVQPGLAYSQSRCSDSCRIKICSLTVQDMLMQGVISSASTSLMEVSHVALLRHTSLIVAPHRYTNGPTIKVVTNSLTS